MNGKLKNSFLFNLALVLLVCAGLYFIFFASLGLLTRHANEAKVPNVTGKDLRSASASLTKVGFTVEIDSSYDPEKNPFLVLSQIPEPGSTVKQGRTIFLTVNKASAPATPMPKLTDLSYRSAVLILKSSRLVLGDTFHRADYAKGAVLDQLYNGRPIKPGDMVPQGSRIDLVIGTGFGNVEMNVPDVIGMTPDVGLSLLSGNGLIPIVMWDEPITDSFSAIIYMQTPAPQNELEVPNRIKEGDIIDIRIKQNPSEEELERNKRPAAGVRPSNENE